MAEAEEASRLVEEAERVVAKLEGGPAAET